MSKKICIVDDTPDLLDNLSQFLKMEGYEVWPFPSAHKALEKIERETPDLIITDLWMPAMDGLEFADRVKAMDHLKTVPITIFSAKPFQEYQDKARKAGINSYIKKPATLEEILKTVTDLLIS
jgi:DNA-binding response OmpR family regulator